MIDYMIIAAIAAAVAGIVITYIKKRRRGESGCSCRCDGCSSSAGCNQEQILKKSKINKKIPK